MGRRCLSGRGGNESQFGRRQKEGAEQGRGEDEQAGGGASPARAGWLDGPPAVAGAVPVVEGRESLLIMFRDKKKVGGVGVR